MIDPVAGSGSTLVAAIEMGRRAYGFEIKKDYYKAANRWIAQVKAQGGLFVPHGNRRVEQSGMVFDEVAT